jgi:hypothetical protein
VPSKVKVDEDFVWELANSIRWLSQTFKHTFKIERFLFGEIYANYHDQAPEFILALLEELGHDQEENPYNEKQLRQASSDESLSPTKSQASSQYQTSNGSTITQISTQTTIKTKLTTTQNRSFESTTKSTTTYETVKYTNQSGNNEAAMQTPVKRIPLLDLGLYRDRDDSNSSCSFSASVVGRVSSLFEDFSESNDVEVSCMDELSQTVSIGTTSFGSDDQHDSLTEFKKKKLYDLKLT